MGDRVSGNANSDLGKFQEAIEYHNKYLSIAQEVSDRVGEGRTYCNLGDDYCFLEKLQEAKECFQSSVKVFDIVRASLKSQGALKISFRDLYRVSYNDLCNTLLALGLSDEALFAAEQCRAQALVDSLRIQYGLTALPSTSPEPKETIFVISQRLTKKKQTVFLALQGNIINFWVIRNENKIELRQTQTGGRKGREDSITMLLDTSLKKIGAAVGVRCENHSLDESTDDSPSSRGDDEEPAQSSLCTIDSLQPLHDAIIGPIADLCQGDELIIVPDGSLCLAPFSALSESIRIHTVPSLTSVKTHHRFSRGLPQKVWGVACRRSVSGGSQKA